MTHLLVIGRPAGRPSRQMDVRGRVRNTSEHRVDTLSTTPPRSRTAAPGAAGRRGGHAAARVQTLARHLHPPPARHQPDRRGPRAAQFVETRKKARRNRASRPALPFPFLPPSIRWERLVAARRSREGLILIVLWTLCVRRETGALGVRVRKPPEDQDCPALHPRLMLLLGALAAANAGATEHFAQLRTQPPAALCVALPLCSY